MNNLTSKTALITGGSKGIGYGIAEALLNEGMNVAITSRSQRNADEAAEKLNNSGKVLTLEADVREHGAMKNAVQQTIDQFGALDVLIANAGIGHFASIEELTDEQWHEVIDINLTGVFHTIRAGVDALKQSEGYFITIASLAGTNFFKKGAAYNASKFGLVGFTQAVMLDLRKHNIKTTTIMPGSVATHFNDHDPDAQEDAWKIWPEDLGQLTVDLLKMHPRTLPSKVEVRPTVPASER